MEVTFLNKIQARPLFGSFELIRTKGLALFSGTPGQPCCMYGTHSKITEYILCKLLKYNVMYSFGTQIQYDCMSMSIIICKSFLRSYSYLGKFTLRIYHVYLLVSCVRVFIMFIYSFVSKENDLLLIMIYN